MYFSYINYSKRNINIICLYIFKIIQNNEFGSIIIALHDKYQSLILNKSIKKCDDLYYESINKLKITYITPIALGFLKNFTWNSGK